MCGKSVFIPLINIRNAAIERLYRKSRLNFRVFHHALAIESFSLAIERDFRIIFRTQSEKTHRVAFSGHFSRVRTRTRESGWH